MHPKRIFFTFAANLSLIIGFFGLVKSITENKKSYFAAIFIDDAGLFVRFFRPIASLSVGNKIFKKESTNEIEQNTLFFEKVANPFKDSIPFSIAYTDLSQPTILCGEMLFPTYEHVFFAKKKELFLEVPLRKIHIRVEKVYPTLEVVGDCSFSEIEAVLDNVQKPVKFVNSFLQSLADDFEDDHVSPRSAIFLNFENGFKLTANNDFDQKIKMLFIPTLNTVANNEAFDVSVKFHFDDYSKIIKQTIHQNDSRVKNRNRFNKSEMKKLSSPRKTEMSQKKVKKSSSQSSVENCESVI